MHRPPKPAKILRFDVRGRRLPASTDDDQLTFGVRVLSIVAGFLFVAIGLGIAGLLAWGAAAAWKEGLGSRLRTVVLFPVPLGIAAYGGDLVGRGILGRPWSRRLWQALDVRFSRRAQVWVPVLAVSALFLIPLAEYMARGSFPFEGPMLVLALCLQTFGHELGHLVAARAVGYRPSQLVAGPLAFHVEGHRTRITRRRSWTMLVMGVAAYQPIRQTRAKDFLVIVAGPVANLLLADAALEVWGWPAAAPGATASLLRSFISLGAALAVFNLLPLPRTTSGIALDGRELVDLLRR